MNYSFLSDARNPSFQQGDKLLETIIQDPSTKDRFLYLDSEKLSWKKDEAKKWLASYAKLSALLLLRAEMLGGSPCRGTELTGLQICNTKSQTRRSLFAFDQTIAFLVQYTKNSKNSGSDRMIPHALDAFTATMLISDLVLARPAAQLFAEICQISPPPPPKTLWDEDQQKPIPIAELYHTRIFVNINKEFTTQDITSLLLKRTKVLYPNGPSRVNLSSWRHISIAIRDKTCPKVKAFLDQYAKDGQEDSSVEALQSGHSSHTESHHYARSSSQITAIPEQLVDGFLKASIRWHHICCTVPGKSSNLNVTFLKLTLTGGT